MGVIRISVWHVAVTAKKGWIRAPLKKELMTDMTGVTRRQGCHLGSSASHTPSKNTQNLDLPFHKFLQAF